MPSNDPASLMCSSSFGISAGEAGRGQRTLPKTETSYQFPKIQSGPPTISLNSNFVVFTAAFSPRAAFAADHHRLLLLTTKATKAPFTSSDDARRCLFVFFLLFFNDPASLIAVFPAGREPGGRSAWWLHAYAWRARDLGDPEPSKPSALSRTLSSALKWNFARFPPDMREL